MPCLWEGAFRSQKGRSLSVRSGKGWKIFELSVLAVLVFSVLPAKAADSEQVLEGDPKGAILPELVEDEPVQVLDEIRVTGTKLANQQSIAVKREATQILDVLSSDEVGRLPDYNVASALRRAPGVYTQFEEDEGHFVSVRGLEPEFTFVQMDGVTVPAIEIASRATGFDNIPAAAFGRLEVYKTLTPDLDGNAIGGLVNLRTRSAFDHDGLYVSLSPHLAYYTFNDVPRSDHKNGLSYRVDGIISDTFGSGNNWGYVITANVNHKDRDELKHRPQGRYTTIDGDSLSTGMRVNTYDNEIDRYGVLSKLEYRTPYSYSFLRLNFFRQEDDEIRYEHRADARGTLTRTGPGALSATEGRARAGVHNFPILRDTYGLHFKTTHDFNTDQQLDVSAAFHRNKRKEDQPTVQFQAQDPALSLTTINRDEVPSVTFDDPSFYLNPANYAFTGAGDTRVRTKQDIAEFALDFSDGKERSDDGFGYKSGLKFRRMKHSHKVKRVTKAYLGTTPLTLDAFVMDSLYQPPHINHDLVVPDPSKFDTFVAANPGLFNITETNAIDALHAGHLQEDVLAAYGLGVFASGRYRLTAGLRYEKTYLDAKGSETVDGAVSRVTHHNDYQNFLPSVHFTVDLRKELRLRLAYSRAIGRPNYDHLIPADRVNTAVNTITEYNRDLKPRVADNLDASLEWYFDDGNSLLSLAVFYKDIQNEITLRSSTRDINGMTFDVFRPENAESANVKGLEVSLVKNYFDFLPTPLDHFGVAFNYTYLDGEFTTADRKFHRLLSQPRHMVNMALLYTQDRFEGRFAINHVSSWLNAAGATTATDRVFDSHTQLDLQARYHLTDWLTLQFEAINLTNENRRQIRGDGNLHETFEYGQSYWLGVIFSN